MKISKIIPFALVLTTQVALADPVAVGGFVDAQLLWNNKTNTLNFQNKGVGSGIQVSDGAVYVSKKAGDAEAKVDLNFSSFGANGSELNFAEGKSQAWVGYAYGKTGLSWKLGQFDTIYGFELNDSPELFMANQGLIYQRMMPVTHAGLLASYKPMENVTINLLAAAPGNAGSLATNTKPDFGAQVGFTMGAVRASAGYLMSGKVLEETPSLLDIVVGTTVGAFAIDVEFSSLKVAGVADSGTGILAHVVYTMSDTCALGLRGETLSKVAFPGVATPFDKQMQITAGPQWALTKELKTNFNYSFNSGTAVAGAEAETGHSAVISAEMTF